MASVELTWTDTASSEDGFRVYRSTTATPSFPGDYTQIDSLAADTTSYTDEFVPEKSSVTYAVSAYNDVGESSSTTTRELDLVPQTLKSLFTDTDSISVSVGKQRELTSIPSDTELVTLSIERLRELSVPLSDTESVSVSVNRPRELTVSAVDTESVSSGGLKERIKSAYTDGDYEELATILTSVDGDVTVVADAEQRLVVQID